MIETGNAFCAICSQGFTRRNSLHTLCSPKCAVKAHRVAERAKSEAAAADRRETRIKREALKPRAKWLSEAQAAFNAFVRARDEVRGLPCISCGRHHQGSWDAGHYLSRGARPELRFNEANCHRQCVPCNQHLHGNLALYRVGLIERIGSAAVEGLEGPHDTAHWTIDELKAIKAMYSRRARELKAQLELVGEAA